MARITYYPLRDDNAPDPSSFDGIGAVLQTVQQRSGRLLRFDASGDPADFANAVLPQQVCVFYSFRLIAKLDTQPAWRYELLTLGDYAAGNVFTGISIYLDPDGRIYAEAVQAGNARVVQSGSVVGPAAGQYDVTVAVDFLSGDTQSLKMIVRETGEKAPRDIVVADLVAGGITNIDALQQPQSPYMSVGVSYLNDAVQLSDLSVFKYDGSRPPGVDVFAALNSSHGMDLDGVVLEAIKYPESFRLRLGSPLNGVTMVGQKARVITLVDPLAAPVTATVDPVDSAGSGSESVTILAPDLVADEGVRKIWGISVEFSGLLPFTRYRYTVEQSGDGRIEGSFWTVPATGDTTRTWSALVGTCDNPEGNNPSNIWSTIKTLVEQSDPPVLLMATIDDIDYVDSYEFDDTPATGFSNSPPQTSGLALDYRKSWARSYGLYPAAPKWREYYRQWCYRNIPAVFAPGDHAIEGNHCRGRVGNGDYHGCSRGPGSLEEFGKEAYDLYYGCINPDPLAPDMWHWGLQIGQCKFACFNLELTCQPFAGTDAGDRYGPAQLAEINNYLDDDDVPFKIAFHEAGTFIGQPWALWHPAEYAAWLADFLSRPNLNGTNGGFVSVFGDTHLSVVDDFGDYFEIGVGTLGDATTITSPTSTPAGVQSRTFIDSSVNHFNDRAFAFFGKLTANSDQSLTVEVVKPGKSGPGESAWTGEMTYGNGNRLL